MGIKTKRNIAIILAALCAASVTGNTFNAKATENTESTVSADETGSASGDVADESGESSEEEPQQNVTDTGEVVQEGASGKIDKSEWITIKDYEKVAESDTYEMYYYEPRLSIILKDKKTGKLIESTLSDEKDDGAANSGWVGYMKSGVVVNAIKGTNNAYQADLINSPVDIKTEKKDNGISASLYFKEYKFGFTVNVTLDGNDLVTEIPESSIKEDKEGTYISTISLFPFMGYTFMDEQSGYMLVPDGNGALIYLNNKEGRYTTGFSQMIYGNDAGFTDSTTKNYLWKRYETVVNPDKVIAPVFGMAHTDDKEAYIAVVESGDKRASIEAHPNGAMVNYNRCFAKFKIRDTYVQPLNQSNSGTVINVEKDRTHEDLRVRYMLLQGDDANYSGMAVTYRNYLLKNNLVTKKDDSYKTRVDFLGSDREKFMLGTSAVKMTDTDDIRNIYSELQNAGVSSLLTEYRGWQKGGIYNVPITKYKADSAIGGTRDLTRLIKEASDKGYDLYLYNDALRVNATTNSFTYNVTKKVNKRTLTEETNGKVYSKFYYLLPERSEEDLTKFVKSYTDKGVSNLALGGITENIFTYSKQGEFFTRNDTAATWSKAVSEINENANVIMEEPFFFLWNSTDAFLNMPLGSSDYMYTDEEVPFLSMVLKGIIPMYSDYVNFEANKTEFFLQMVESGVYPSFYVTAENSSKLINTNSADLYSTDYSTYKDMIIDYDKQLREVNAATAGASILKHEKLDNGVTVVTYDNGVKIYVNYTGESETADGVSVDSMSYKVVK
ncbi:MAG: DUF5696 domain-containing protein [Catonella sp.]|nr:DUF5696 domain-containing protein [Catonella sp.]MDY6357162.1 DUF5696 domain-containing protein [Catonella sp.]